MGNVDMNEFRYQQHDATANETIILLKKPLGEAIIMRCGPQDKVTYDH